MGVQMSTSEVSSEGSSEESSEVSSDDDEPDDGRSNDRRSDSSVSKHYHIIITLSHNIGTYYYIAFYLLLVFITIS